MSGERRKGRGKSKGTWTTTKWYTELKNDKYCFDSHFNFVGFSDDDEEDEDDEDDDVGVGVGVGVGSVWLLKNHLTASSFLPYLVGGSFDNVLG